MRVIAATDTSPAKTMAILPIVSKGRTEDGKVFYEGGRRWRVESHNICWACLLSSGSEDRQTDIGVFFEDKLRSLE